MLLRLPDRYAPFIYDVWKHPDTLAIISKIAGVELVTEMDFEIAHINMSTKSEKEKVEEMEAFVEKTYTDADEGIAGCPWEDVSHLRDALIVSLRCLVKCLPKALHSALPEYV